MLDVAIRSPANDYMEDDLYACELIGMTDGCTSVSWPDKKILEG